MISVRRILTAEWALLEQVEMMMKAGFLRPLVRMGMIPLHLRPMVVMIRRVEERFWMMEGRRGKS